MQFVPLRELCSPLRAVTNLPRMLIETLSVVGVVVINAVCGGKCRYFTVKEMCWDSSVRIATRYGLDGPGIECRWERDFLHPSTSVLGSTQPPTQ